MDHNDTIAAISSGVGVAARIIVRVSGPSVRHVLESLTSDHRFEASEARLSSIALAGLRVPVFIYTFAAPRSATGQDVVEFHIPGNPLLARMLLDEMIRLGARQAEPGEFTARSFFNGRIGLSEAEGVAATIAAQNQYELNAARQLMAGELAKRVAPLLELLAGTLALIEAGIDFSEEDISFLPAAQLLQRIDETNSSLTRLMEQSSRWERLTHEPAIVLVGRPNAGKSTLFNALARQERAVVSNVAGTTRDVIWAKMDLPRGIVRLIDVAGLDNSDNDSISLQMQSHAINSIERADIVVMVRDCTDDRPPPAIERMPDLLVASKADLGGTVRGDELAISVASEIGLDVLRQQLDDAAFQQSASAQSLCLNARHVRLLQESQESLLRARNEHRRADVVAQELRESLDCLGGIIGSVTPDDVLGRIFSSFCIGK